MYSTRLSNACLFRDMGSVSEKRLGHTQAFIYRVEVSLRTYLASGLLPNTGSKFLGSSEGLLMWPE